MQVAPERERAIDEFVPDRDILYFRVGHHGLVSFHGRNFNWRKRFSNEELQSMCAHPCFVQVNTDCYVNTTKVASVKEGCVHFQTGDYEGKTVVISRLRQLRLKELLKRPAINE